MVAKRHSKNFHLSRIENELVLSCTYYNNIIIVK